VPKRNPHERRPRAPDWKPAGTAVAITDLAAAEMRQLIETSA
jgi:hypothetical protein